MSLSPPLFLDNDTYQIGYLKAVQATVIFPTEEYQIRTGAINPRLKPYAQPNDSKIMYWGEGNDFPQMIIDLYSKDPLVPVTLGKMAASIIEGGLFACKVVDYNPDGSEVVQAIMDNQEINNFLNAIWFQRYLHETANDLVWFFNAFPGLILSADRSKILQLDANEAAYCRWSVQNERGKSPYVYINANWPGVTSEDELSKKLPVIDPYTYDPYTPVRESGWYNYLYPISYPTPGRHFYQLAHHDSIRTSGWLDVHQAIPQFKKYMMSNQMAIKYHWKVDVEYWAKAYGDKWTKADAAAARAGIGARGGHAAACSRRSCGAPYDQAPDLGLGGSGARPDRMPENSPRAFAADASVRAGRTGFSTAAGTGVGAAGLLRSEVASPLRLIRSRRVSISSRTACAGFGSAFMVTRISRNTPRSNVPRDCEAVDGSAMASMSSSTDLRMVARISPVLVSTSPLPLYGPLVEITFHAHHHTVSDNNN